MADMQQTPQPTKGGVDLDRIRAALSPVLVAHGISLVDVEWGTDRAGWTLRLIIEREGDGRAEGGVTLEDCADVSRDASAILDVEDLIPQHYYLEVSSPGLERKLRTLAEFVRFTGKKAKVKLKRPAPDGQRLLRGPLDPAPEGRVAVILDGKRIEVPYEDVAEANLVYELETQPKPQKGARASKAKATRGKEPRASKRT
jgi:ribosome maturation factor RimP